MKNKLWIILLLILVVCSGLVQATDGKQYVQVVDPVVNTIEVQEIVTGLVLSYTDVMIPAKVGGVVEEVRIQIGQKVKAGETLILFEQDQIRIQLDQAKAALEIAQANLALVKKGASDEELQQVQATVDQAQASYQAAQSNLVFAQSMFNDRRMEEQQLLAAKTQLDMAEKQLELADERLNQTQIGLEMAKSDYERMSYLFENGVITQQQYEGIETQYQNAQSADQSTKLAKEQAQVSYNSAVEGYRLAEEMYNDRRSAEQQLDGANTQLKVTKANLSIAQANLTKVKKGATLEQLQISQANLKQAQAALRLVELQLENTIVVSPIDGVVAQVNVDGGEMVGPGTPVVTIINIDQVYVKADVTADLLRYLQVGDQVSVEIGAVPDKKRHGKIQIMSPIADPRSQAFPIKVLLNNPGHHLKPGMYADVYLTVQKSVNTTLLPIEAILDLNRSPYIYVLKGSHAEKRFIQTGVANDQQVEILKGIQTGEKVIIKGQHLVEDGEQVEVIQ